MRLAKVVGQLLPSRFTQFVHDQRRLFAFRRALKRFHAAFRQGNVSDKILQDLVYGWDNAGYSAREEFLREAVGLAGKTGPILECGSGLSTILMGVVAQEAGNQIISLEHHEAWAQRVAAKLRQCGIRSCTICHAPLKNYGDYTWYDISPEKVPSSIAAVICDGPPGDTLGGRYGLVPRMRQRLKPGCIILLDDAQRIEEQEIAARWARELGATSTIVGTQKPFARVIVPC